MPVFFCGLCVMTQTYLWLGQELDLVTSGMLSKIVTTQPQSLTEFYLDLIFQSIIVLPNAF